DKPRRAGIASAAARELHLGTQPRHLSLLEVRQLAEFGYRKQFVRRRRRRRVPFRLRRRDRSGTAQGGVRRQSGGALKERRRRGDTASALGSTRRGFQLRGNGIVGSRRRVGGVP